MSHVHSEASGEHLDMAAVDAAFQYLSFFCHNVGVTLLVPHLPPREPA